MDKLNSLSSHLSPGQILKERLHDYQLNFKAIHINAQSLKGHLDLIVEIFQAQNTDVIAVSESWLKPHIRSKDVAIPGYKLLRNDRLHRNGGGVAVYVKLGLKYRFVFVSSSGYTNSPEFMFIEISLPNSKQFLFGVCYRPPKAKIFVEFKRAVLYLRSYYKDVVIMGDFNADILANKLDVDRSQVTGLLKSCNLSVLPLAPTHHTDTSHSLIDLIVVSNSHNVIHHGQLPVPHISWHDLIYCVLDYQTTAYTTEFIDYCRKLNL